MIAILKILEFLILPRTCDKHRPSHRWSYWKPFIFLQYVNQFELMILKFLILPNKNATKIDRHTNGIIENHAFPGVFSSCWSHDIEILNITKDVQHKSTVTPMELLKTAYLPQVFWSFWNHDIEFLNITKDVRQKSTVTPMELLNTNYFPYVFW